MNLPFNYYMGHFLWAMALLLGFKYIDINFAYGFALSWYISRETTQWPDYERKFDWKGLLYPTIGVTLLFFLIR